MEHKLPKWLRVILIFISIITVVYWIGFLFYWILESIRLLLHLISHSKKGYWLFIICILVSCLICLLFAQFYFNLNPVGKVYGYICEAFNYLKEMLIEVLV